MGMQGALGDPSTEALSGPGSYPAPAMPHRAASGPHLCTWHGGHMLRPFSPAAWHRCHQMGWGCYCHWEDQAWAPLSSEQRNHQEKEQPRGDGVPVSALRRVSQAQRTPAASPQGRHRDPQIPGQNCGISLPKFRSYLCLLQAGQPQTTLHVSLSLRTLIQLLFYRVTE